MVYVLKQPFRMLIALALHEEDSQMKQRLSMELGARFDHGEPRLILCRDNERVLELNTERADEVKAIEILQISPS